MKELVSLLTELREEVLIFPNKDLLVNINSKKAYKLHDSTEKCNPELKRIIREAVAIEKTSGINPICISEGVIQLKLNSKDTYTPIFLTPVEIQLDTLNDTFKMLKLAEKKMVNPFLINHFKITFNPGLLLS